MQKRLVAAAAAGLRMAPELCQSSSRIVSYVVLTTLVDREPTARPSNASQLSAAISSASASQSMASTCAAPKIADPIASIACRANTSELGINS